MKGIPSMVLSAGLAFGLAACDKKDTTTTTTTTTTTSTKTPTGTTRTEIKTETTRPSEPTAAPAGADIGVAECDEYIQKMSDCSSRMAPEAAGPMKDSIETMRKAWKDASSTPEGKTALASGCKQALDAAKGTYASMGCTF